MCPPQYTYSMNEQPSLFSILRETVTFMRCGDYGDAASRMNCAFRLLEPLIGSYDESRKKQISYSLETLFLMQKNEDWVACADVIEYELLKLL
jgi:hypothetical protein